MAKLLKISPSSGLSLFKDCPYCFWQSYHNDIKRPKGIFPSLPSGMDTILKAHYDNFRGDLPPELKGKIEGTLLKDMRLMNEWRNWKTGLSASFKDINAMLFGALDDCLMVGKAYVPLDYKTKGSLPREGDSEQYYGDQLDSYTLMLHAKGLPTTDYAYLVYYSPHGLPAKQISIPKVGIYFDVTIVKVPVDKDRVKEKLYNAVEVARSENPPDPASHCDFCNYLREVEHG